jgi:WD40 repeat protein
MKVIAESASRAFRQYCRAISIGICHLRGIAYIFCLITFIGGAAVEAQERITPTRPTVRLSSPFAGPVWRVDVDAEENFAVASNAAKSVTIWPVLDARSSYTARVPLENQERKLAHAVAISPDAELIAYSVPPTVDDGGRNKPNSSKIYIIRRATGKILHVLDGDGGDLATRPQSIKFSPDGVHLAAVLSSACGVRVWTTRDWRLAFKDDVGYGGEPNIDRCCRTWDARCDALPDSTGVHFLKPANGSPYLVTSGDSGVWIYDKANEAITLRAHATPASLDLERPAGIAVSPAGDRLLIGDRRNQPPPLRLRIAVIEAATLQPVHKPLEIRESALRSGVYLQGGPNHTDMAQASLERVAWLDTAAGEYLIGAGAFPCEIVKPELLVAAANRGAMCLARWSSTRLDDDPRFVPVGSERVIDVAAMPRHRGLLILSQQRVALIDPDGSSLAEGGRELLDQRNTTIDLRDSDGRFRISADGRTIELEDYRVLTGETGLLTFDLGGPSVRAGGTGGAASIDPDHGRGTAPPIVEDWRNVRGRSPRVAGQQLRADEFGHDETVRAVAIVRDQKRVVLASSEFLRVVSYADTLPVVLCRQPVTEEAYRVNITPDGMLIVSGHSDGVLRWWRLRQRDRGCQFEPLVSVHLSERSPGRWTWTAWRPNGLYARDMDSDIKLEWQRTLKDGQVGLTEFQRLLFLIDREAIRHAADPEVGERSPDDVARGQPPDEDTLVSEQKREPLIELTGPQSIYRLTSGRATLRFTIGEGRGWPKRLAIRLRDETPLTKVYNGQTIAAADSVVLEQANASGRVVAIDIDLPAKARMRTGADIQLCFFVDDSQEPDSCHPLKWMGQPALAPPRRMWALLVGVSKAAEGSNMDLRYAVNDAIDLARLFINDYERRVVRKTSRVSPDFSLISIDLAVSAHPDAAAEIEMLARRPYVTLRGATKADIAAALQKVAQEIEAANRTEPADDLFVMAYSGHGMVDPNRPGGSAFLTTDATALIRSDRELREVGAKALTSEELLHLLRQIPARKLIIVDACRSISKVPTNRPFSPEMMRTEFESQSLDTHFFFASDVGQESFELDTTAFDRNRPKARQGNGIFTYALLSALTTPRTDVRPPAPASRIDIPWIASFLKNVFFDLANPRSPANLLRTAKQLRYVPTPKYIPARSDQGDQLIRTLEPSTKR